MTIRADKVGEDTTLAQVVRLAGKQTRAKPHTTNRRPVCCVVPAVRTSGRIHDSRWLASERRKLVGRLSTVAGSSRCRVPVRTGAGDAHSRHGGPCLAGSTWDCRKGVCRARGAGERRHIRLRQNRTLTRGSPALSEIHSFGDADDDDVLRVAAVAERRSEHLLARTIVQEAEERGFIVPGIDDIDVYPGSGVVARARSTQLGTWSIADSQSKPDLEAHEHLRTVVVGNRALIAERRITLTDEVLTAVQRLDDSAHTPLIVAVDKQILGVIGLRDELRDTSANTLAELRGAGINRFALLTGDREASARAVGAAGQFDVVLSEQLPADKARWIESQTANGHRVAMVGDCINDGPALSSASVGIALGGVGSDIAAEAGDLILMGDPIRPLPELVRFSKAFVRNIRQNIFVFGFLWNTVGFCCVGLGILSPVAGAILHECGSLAVMLSALRLLWFGDEKEAVEEQPADGLLNQAVGFVNRLSPTQLVFRAIEQRHTLARLAFAGVALAWLTSGLVRIRSDEQALVTRFGKLHDELEPGVYWRWPRPLERIHRARTDHLRSVVLGPESVPPANQADGTVPPIEWATDHNRDADDVLHILTGDEVSLEATASVVYRIGNLRRFVFGTHDVAEILRAAAESVLREQASQRVLGDLLTESRRKFESVCLQQLDERIALYNIGIEVAGFDLLDLHPPKPVVAAYREVADAVEYQAQRHNDARAYADGRLLTAAGEKFVAALDSSTEQSPAELTAAVWHRLKSADDPSMGEILSGEAARTINESLGRASATEQRSDGIAERFRHLLGAWRSNASLTGDELYWKTVSRSLTGREKTIIDPRVDGRHRLYLTRHKRCLMYHQQPFRKPAAFHNCFHRPPVQMIWKISPRETKPQLNPLTSNQLLFLS